MLWPHTGPSSAQRARARATPQEAAPPNRGNGLAGHRRPGTEAPGIEAFLEYVDRNGESHYRMRPELREAIEELPGLYEAVSWPLDRIRETYRDSWWSDHAAQREQLSKSD